MSVVFLKIGPLSMSVCVPADWPREQVEREVNAAHLCGTEYGWQIAADPTFKDGSPNPCPCDRHPGRLHYFMDC